MLKKFFGALCAVLVLCALAQAGEVRLKNGQVFSGKVRGKDGQRITIESEGLSMPYFVDEIESINGQDPSLVVVEEIPMEEDVSGGDPAVREPVAVITEGISEMEEAADKTFSPVARQERNPADLFSGMSPQEKEKLQGMIVPIIAVILVLVVASYVFSSYCMMRIADKLSIGPGWWAWVPIANLFLMFKMAGVSYWWMFIFLASFIPVIGPLAVSGFSIYLWYKIIVARNKPAWMTVLMIIPLANMGVIAYLAFSE
jgi:hypothetical protein